MRHALEGHYPQHANRAGFIFKPAVTTRPGCQGYLGENWGTDGRRRAAQSLPQGVRALKVTLPSRHAETTALALQHNPSASIYTRFIQKYAILLVSDSYITHYTLQNKGSQRCHRRTILVPQSTFKQTVFFYF